MSNFQVLLNHCHISGNLKIFLYSTTVTRFQSLDDGMIKVLDIAIGNYCVHHLCYNNSFTTLWSNNQSGKCIFILAIKCVESLTMFISWQDQSMDYYLQCLDCWNKYYFDFSSVCLFWVFCWVLTVWTQKWYGLFFALTKENSSHLDSHFLILVHFLCFVLFLGFLVNIKN